MDGGSLKPYRLFPSVRLVIVFLVSFAGFNSNLSWFTLNFNIACMVNATYINDMTYSNSSEYADCPNSAETESYQGTFLWDRNIQVHILAATAYGSIISVLATAVVLDRFDTKKICVVAMLLCGAGAFLSPLAAYKGWVPLLIVRIIQGLGIGIPWPACYLVATIWFPAPEFGLLTGIMVSAYAVGALAALLVSGGFCGSVGWEASFYFAGAMAIACGICWLFLYSGTVEHHRFISEEEAVYILRRRTYKATPDRDPLPIPWKDILTSGAVWAVILSDLSFWYTTSFISDFLPTYFKEVLRLASVTNGALAAVPFLIQILGRNLAGYISDKLQTKFSPTVSVKICEIICGFGPAVFLVVMTIFTCKNAIYAVVCLSIAYLFFGFTVGGFMRATMHIAPKYTGLIAGISTGISYFAGIACPYITDVLVPHGSAAGWHSAFYVAAGFRCFTTIYFLFLASANVQTWADESRRRIRTINLIED